MKTAIDNETFNHYREIQEKIKQSKHTLKENGYYTDTLWSVKDIQDQYRICDDTAKYILNKVFSSEYLSECIRGLINNEIKELQTVESEDNNGN